ncbi:pilus assembly protein N-terminal domain-containing protein [Ferrimonas sp. YFM]|uniref:pilus assembly protein N-terminal domain-containing protein n=1 Tax=Ferrimonas sp. YFM TaxID=3028878 RepID=UPI002573EC27|nr:pilus assembly protein N-terminal domain-containing protein [Ferrimonas sp. YFM]BDY04292.1 hypothetical protein F0521_13330 [Ferrimonas sp. YFM]
MMIMRVTAWLVALLVTVVMALIPATAATYNLDEGGAKTLRSSKPIDTVFISNAKVADYKVVDNHKVVVFGVSPGLSTVILYDQEGGIGQSHPGGQPQSQGAGAAGGRSLPG